MQSLYCQASDCIHNMSGNCSANTIQVSNTKSETYCDTYVKSGSMVAGDAALSEAEFAGKSDTEFAAEFTGSPKIACNVSECVFNKSFHCRARDINIQEPHDTMLCNCKTYRPK